MRSLRCIIIPNGICVAEYDDNRREIRRQQNAGLSIGREGRRDVARDEVLQSRLKSINSRLPALKKVKMMTMEELFQQLETVVNQATEKAFLEQLSPLLPRPKLDGLFPIFQAQLRALVGDLRRSPMYRSACGITLTFTYQ